VSLGTGIYRWPLEVAAKIAVAELSKSEFDKTLMRFAARTNVGRISRGEEIFRMQRLPTT